MGKDLKETFLHEKMLNITNQRCTSKPPWAIASHHMTGAGKEVEKLGRLCPVGGNEKWCSLNEKQYSGSSES